MEKEGERTECRKVSCKQEEEEEELLIERRGKKINRISEKERLESNGKGEEQTGTGQSQNKLRGMKTQEEERVQPS